MNTLPADSAPARRRAAPDSGCAPPQPTLAEVFADSSGDGAVTGFVLAHLTGGTVLWVQDRLSAREGGRPYPQGFGVAVEMLHLQVTRPADVLWAMEQALACRALAAVVGEIHGAAPAVDFTATKRLALRAEAHGVACWLVRRAATADLSAARERWRVGALPSATDPDDPRAPGDAIWRADLFRARWRSPAAWVARYDRVGHRMDLSHPAEAAAAVPLQAQAG